MKPRAVVPAAVPAALLAALLALAACSSPGGDSGATSDTAGVAADTDGTDGADGGARSSETGSDGGVARVAAQQSEPVEAVERSVIRTGNVELSADDVGKAQFEVQRVVDRYAGQVSAEETTTDDDGQPAYTRMELRIPTESFGEAMAALKEIAEFESAATGEEDVTAKVIDTRTRLAAQRRSIARITVLFDRAQSIRDIMRIESELSRRQAALESLQRQAAHLSGQTAMSTITVSIDQTPQQAAPKQDDAGFLTGLEAGWGALATFAVALATAVGALLPWLLVLGVVGFPALLVWRRRRPRRTGRTPSAA